MKFRLASLLVCLVSICFAQKDPRLKGSFREDKNGWIQIHLEGAPSEIGFQHGYLLSDEITDAVHMMGYFLKGSTQREWNFYRQAAERMFWPKLDPEYREEIRGIVDGLRAKGKKFDRADITALNGWIELAWYYVPYLAEKAGKNSMNNKAPGNCSAFIATGSYTQDGKIVMAHNSWVDYIVGERWNIVVDIVPQKGHRIMMDAFPGYIHSGDDFAMNDAGILNTETTITQFKGFKESGTPEFMRARKATQYAESIDDFVRIMTADNNGGYANTWLIGDLRSNEIARFDLGLKHHKVWRTHDGVFVGSNFGTDEKMLSEETTFDTANKTSSPNARKTRWGQIMEAHKGKINIELAKEFEADHVDGNSGQKASDRCVICGHLDHDPKGAAEWSNPPYYPFGSVNGKVTNAALAGELKFWAKMGHPCGDDFVASSFLKEHPEFKWQGRYLKDMKSNRWTLFESRQ
jgi:hypothetical protein